MARGNKARRALIAELGLQAQAEAISTKRLEEMKIERILAQPKRRRKAVR